LRDSDTMTKFECHYDPAAAGEVIPAYKEIPRDGWSGGTGVRSPRRPATAGLLAMTVKSVLETQKEINRQEPYGDHRDSVDCLLQAGNDF
jgi:hypothetical protein